MQWRQFGWVSRWYSREVILQMKNCIFFKAFFLLKFQTQVTLCSCEKYRILVEHSGQEHSADFDMELFLSLHKKKED